MIIPEFARVTARYDRWQNRSLVAAADALSDGERRRDRGAFLRSVAETLNHVLRDDRIWLACLRGDEATAAEIGRRHPHTDAPRDWSAYARERTALDEEIVPRADDLTEADLAREIAWMRGEEAVRTQHGFCVVHMANHQIHHRGQVHAMLTAAGTTPEATDLPVIPDRG